MNAGPRLLAILYYDYFLTLPQEIERYWKARMSWGAFLFYANRYLAILAHIPIIYEYFGDTSETVSRSRSVHRPAVSYDSLT